MQQMQVMTLLHIIGFLQDLLKKRKKKKNFQTSLVLAKHTPPPSKRIEALNKEIKKKGLEKKPGARGKERFLKNKKDLI